MVTVQSKQLNSLRGLQKRSVSKITIPEYPIVSLSELFTIREREICLRCVEDRSQDDIRRAASLILELESQDPFQAYEQPFHTHQGYDFAAAHRLPQSVINSHHANKYLYRIHPL